MQKLIFLMTFLTGLSAFEPFTGKITRDRVRMRLMPDLTSKILKEFAKNDLVTVVDETEEYFAIKPSPDQKAYVFRSFVLDGIVEANHVNVRLGPDLESPVIGQLKQQDTVEGVICETNPKWLEITPPETVHFFVYKEYIEKMTETKEEEPLPSFESFTFEEIKEEKKTLLIPSAFTDKELLVFEKWKEEKNGSLEEFYEEQKKESQLISGIVKPFTAQIYNKPGDFLLLNPITLVPTCYLYSTQISLEALIGKEVTLRVCSRDNHDFALQAYTVLTLE
jgi:hypothetical protein